MKRLPGETNWVDRKAMLCAPDLTFRNPKDDTKVLNCIRRMDVKTDGGVEMQSEKSDPKSFSGGVRAPHAVLPSPPQNNRVVRFSLALVCLSAHPLHWTVACLL
eukprot:COSAG05_NODE_390_length_10436_cov_15.721196_7_plen_104_part_00